MQTPCIAALLPHSAIAIRMSAVHHIHSLRAIPLRFGGRYESGRAECCPGDCSTAPSDLGTTGEARRRHRHRRMHAVLRQGTVLGTFYREVRGMRDGGCIALDWWRGGAGGGAHEASAPIVLVLHGITGAPLRLPPAARTARGSALPGFLSASGLIRHMCVRMPSVRGMAWPGAGGAACGLCGQGRRRPVRDGGGAAVQGAARRGM